MASAGVEGDVRDQADVKEENMAETVQSEGAEALPVAVAAVAAVAAATAEDVSGEPAEEFDLSRCAADLSQFFQVDTTPQTKDLDEQIEGMLQHIQEFCGHLATIQTDTSYALQHKIPEIHSRAMQLKGMYQQVDDLEAFVAMVSKNVADMEESVNCAEKQFGSNAISRAFKGFSKPSFLSGFGSKPKVAPAKPELRHEPPEIFNSNDYFPVSPTSKSSPAAVAAAAAVLSSQGVESGDQ